MDGWGFTGRIIDFMSNFMTLEAAQKYIQNQSSIYTNQSINCKIDKQICTLLVMKGDIWLPNEGPLIKTQLVQYLYGR